jgi:hypothetical protein
VLRTGGGCVAHKRFRLGERRVAHRGEQVARFRELSIERMKRTLAEVEAAKTGL